MRTKMYGIIAAFACLLVFTACESTTGPVSESDTDGDILPGQPQFDPKVTVCNPWGDDATASNRGIVGRLTYMPPGICADENGAALPSRPKLASSYLDLGTAVDVTLFFSRLFVPTRFFDRGFETQDGTLITNASGNTLYEWFGVELLTQLKLSPGDEEGDYQLAVLSALQDVDIPIVFAAGSYTPQPVYSQAVRAWRRKAPVKFVDRMPWHLMSALIRSASVHVLPSFYELPGLVHLECAAAEVPVVASDWGAIADYLPSTMFHACDPLDLESIRSATLTALSAPLAPLAADIAQGYTRERLAENLIRSYERALTDSVRTIYRDKQYLYRPLRPKATGGIHAAV